MWKAIGRTSPYPELEKGWRYVLRIWWSLIWRLVVMQLVFTAIVIYSADAFLVSYPFLLETVKALSVFGIFPLGICALYAVINKNFGAFRLSLIPLGAAETGEANGEAIESKEAPQEKEDKNYAESGK